MQNLKEEMAYFAISNVSITIPTIAHSFLGWIRSSKFHYDIFLMSASTKNQT